MDPSLAQVSRVGLNLTNCQFATASKVNPAVNTKDHRRSNPVRRAGVGDICRRENLSINPIYLIG